MSTDEHSKPASPQAGESAKPFNVQQVDDALAGTIFAGKLHHFPTIDSTQTRALADAAAGAQHGQVYVADEQTAGRGRGGHTWHSEPDRGLYLTVLLRPTLAADDALLLSFAAGLAVQSALTTAAGFNADLRWPNDIVTPPGPGRARKLGGILTECAMSPDGTLKHAAIGIGINLNQTVFPPDLAQTATSVRRETGAFTPREPLLVTLLLALAAEIARLEAESNGTPPPPHVPQSPIRDRFTLAGSWVSGKRVTVDEDEGYTGTTAGLTASGLLQVRCTDGTVRIVRHGGVREALAITTP